MKRVFDFQCHDQETMVSRILLLVHQGIDEAFPGVESSSTRFAKTTFGDEPTANQLLPQEDHSHPWSEPRINLEAPSPRKEPLAVEDEPAPRKRLQQTLIGLALLSLGLIIAYFLA